MQHDSTAEQHSRKMRAILALSLAAALFLFGLTLFLLGRRHAAAGAAPEHALDVGRFATPELPLDRGLALVLFLSPDCSHCIEAAGLVGTFDAEAHGLRVYYVLLAKPKEVEPFFQTIGHAAPYCLATPQDYAEFAGDFPPTLYLLNHGQVSARWLGWEFNLTKLSEALQQAR